ncbi:MAG: 50S ribosomal protein L21 [Ignavibacteria bacterium]|nr:50S ribosomal protein L21 [Ignavibacteria bacterium]
MIAIVDIAGVQFKVKEKDKIYVPKLDIEEGKKIVLSKVLLVSDENKTEIGTPFVASRSVDAKVLEHTKDNKVLVFKKRRRKGYQRLRGHREQLTKIEIEKIN